MISKHIPANSFYHTCRYICNKPGAEVLLAEGVRGHGYKLMAADFEMQQQIRPSKHQACFHSIISFYPGENPSDEIMKEIAEKYLAALGILNTQYAICKHTDKAHLHLHIVANMVSNEGNAIKDGWIGLRGKKIAQRLTEEYRLIPAIIKNIEQTNLEALNDLEAAKYKIYIAIAENLPHCKTMEELESHLLKLGIQVQYKYKGQTNERQGISFKMGNNCFKGSQVDRKFSFIGLQKILGLQNKQTLEEQKKLEQESNKQWDSSSEKTFVSKTSVPDFSERNGKELSYDLLSKLEKAVEILFKPEHANDIIPHELLKKKERRRKKKQSL